MNSDPKIWLREVLDKADRADAATRAEETAAETRHREAFAAFDELRKNVLEPTMASFKVEIEARGHEVTLAQTTNDNARPAEEVTGVGMVVRPRNSIRSALVDEKLPSLWFRFSETQLGSVNVTKNNMSKDESKKKQTSVAPVKMLDANKVGNLIVDVVETAVNAAF